MLDTDLVPARRAGPPRLMIVLHGLGDSMDGYRWLPDALGVDWLSYLLVNAPDDYYGGFSWYDIFGNAGPGVERSRRLLTTLLDDLPNRGFPAGDTLLFGFSQGCLMILETGLRFPHRLGGLIGISGYFHEPARLIADLTPTARQQRILMTHGTQDPLLPIEPVRRQVAQLQEAGLGIEWHEFDKVHTIDGGDELGVIRRFVERCLAPPSS